MREPKNSFEAVKFVLDHAPKDLSAVQRLVLIQIAHHYPTPHLSQTTIAREIGVAKRQTVNRAVKQLVDRHLLKCIRQGVSKANKYQVNFKADVWLKTALMMSPQTAHHLSPQTAHKQTINKQDNKEVFFEFLKLFPNMTVSVDRVYRAWGRACTEVSEDVLLKAASQTEGEGLEPDAWLNFRKFEAYVAYETDLEKIRKASV